MYLILIGVSSNSSSSREQGSSIDADRQPVSIASHSDCIPLTVKCCLKGAEYVFYSSRIATIPMHGVYSTPARIE